MTTPGDAAGEAADPYEVAACGLLTTAGDGTIQRVNQTLAGWVGIPGAALVGRRFQDLLTIGSKLFHQTHWMPLLQMQGSVAEVQLEILHHDGRVIPVLVNAARRGAAPAGPVPRGSQVDIAVFVATDRRKYERELLLARREAESLLAREREAQEARSRAEEGIRQREMEFRTLAENSPDVIMRFDVARRIAYVSPAAERLSGRRLDGYTGQGLAYLTLSDAARSAWETALEVAFTGRESTLDYTFTGRSGAPLELHTHVVPERSPGGEVQSVLAITRDVTALRQAEHEARERATLAEQLIGIVSHDLRNPLNAVLLGTHMLGTVELGAHARTVTRITSAALRANRLITDLLDFTQARLGGGLRVERRPIDLHAIAADTVDELRLATPNRMIEHRCQGEGQGEADADRLAQVVTNLVGNALTYGVADQPVVVTSVIDDDTLQIHVHNRGAPIPEELQSRVFEPMQRGENQVKLGSRSVGLGLYIVREIAMAHAGSVSLRSTEAEGTTFIVAVPRHPRSG